MKTKKRRGLSLKIILISFFTLTFSFSSFMLVRELLRAQHEKSALAELATIVSEAEEHNISPQSELSTQCEETDKDSASIEKELTILPQYISLYEQNSDLFGWIFIENTNINYPVMYTPNDSEFYLKKAFDGSYSESGVPFLDGKCPADGNYYLVYGHHMKDKTMFGQLPEYARQDFYEEHPVIYFDTLFEKREYRVISAFYSCVYDKEDVGVFRYYEYTDLTDESVFDEYVRQVKKAAIYDTGNDVEYGDNLLVLSTCSYHTDNGRFVVVAKQIK